MAARAIWKGTLDLGRSGVPVKLYSAVEDKGVHFHLLEKGTHTRVKQHMVDPDTGKEVPEEKIRKGYEVEPEKFVLIDEDDIESVQPKPSTSIEVPHFLPLGKIGYEYYERPYYLGPDGDANSYFALAQALAKAEREGVARWVMRGKEYTGALQSVDGYLVLITLRYGDEVISARDLRPPAGKAPDAREVKMAEQLMAALEDEFRAEDYKDMYRDRLMQYIEAKARGRRPKLEVMPKQRVGKQSLADALAASLKSAKGRREKAVA